MFYRDSSLKSSFIQIKRTNKKKIISGELNSIQGKPVLGKAEIQRPMFSALVPRQRESMKCWQKELY